MFKNQLASYFTNSSDLSSSNSIDIGGRSFFDLISECKDFNERDSTRISDDSIYDIWPIPENIDSNVPLTDKPFIFAIQDSLTDPIKQLVNKHFGAQEAAKRVLPNSESVIADVNGLQILVKCGCFRSVINLTYKILKNFMIQQQASQRSIYTPYSFQIWFVRIAILMKLKLFKEAELEFKQFENFENPLFFYEYQSESYPDRKGCMIPFGFRMLYAELPQYLGRSEESISILYRLLETVQRIVTDLPQHDENAKKIWHERKFKVLFSIVNILIFRKNYEKAIEILFQIVSSDYSEKCALWSCIGKLFVQIGDLKDASDCFFKAQAHSKQDSLEDKCRNLLNLSLLRIANSNYKEAFETLNEAHLLVPNNSIIINNMAFCLFYSGNLKEAISLIENHINSNSNKIINESLVFNLCSLYELESAKAQQKKLTLLMWLNVYAGDGFYESCLQLQ